ncbi:MAG: TonB-dependent receptor [Candidatus Eiseniibacteriota bacterium]
MHRTQRVLPLVNVIAFAFVLAFAPTSLFLAAPPRAHAQDAGGSVSARVVDAETGAALPGAAAQIVGSRRGATADASGTFRIALAPGETGARVRVSVVGYDPAELDLVPGAPADIRMKATAIPIPGAEVQGHLAAEGRSPTSYSTVTRRDIDRAYWGQDTPILLAETPGAYAYSDAGNGIGYSYLKIRGFSQRRIAVTVNGIPLNDPESREVYWIDHPDLVASAQEIQVQRGVGSTAYGTTALGGSINVETIPFQQDRHLVFEAGAGSFDTQRYSLQAGSGLLENKYAIQARLSRILTDGYRDQSWSDLWSYFVGVARVDRNMVTRLNLYGGPENTHLSYLGIPRSTLDGGVTGDPDQDRRINPIGYPGEQDHFFEPHYELLHDWKVSPSVSVTNALFYFPGEGYYDEFRTGVDLREYNYPDSVITDVARRRWVKNVHLGWVPQLRFTSGRYELTGGLDLRFHEGHHKGTLLWSAAPPAAPEPDHVYYDYKGRTFNTSGFVRQAWAQTVRLRLTLDLAVHHQTYRLVEDEIAGLSFDQPYTFVTPRVGANWTVRETDAGPWQRVEAFASYSRAEAEPIFRELYDPENAGSVPGFRNVSPDGVLSDPILSPEQVADWTAGVRVRGSWGQASFAGFYMDFENEIVYNGQLDDNGNPITGNAARSRHAGIEADASAAVGRHVELAGAFQWNDNRFGDYFEYVDATTTVDYSGNAIAGFPELFARARATFRQTGGRLDLSLEHSGIQYLDNTENERKNPAARQDPAWVDRTIEPWTVANAALGWQFPGAFGGRALTLSLRVMNLFDTRYETAGYVDYPAPDYLPTPVWIPAASRNFFVSAKLSL